MTENRLADLASVDDERALGIQDEWILQPRVGTFWLDRRLFAGKNLPVHVMAMEQLRLNAALANVPKERASADTIQRITANGNVTRVLL